MTKLHFLGETNEGVLSERLLKLSRSNMIRSALELFDSMSAAGLRPSEHACNSLLASVIRKRALPDALRVFKSLQRRELATAHTYSLILKAAACSGGCRAAKELFSAFEEDESMRSFDVVVYNTMMSVYAKEKSWLDAEQTWRKLRSEGVKGTRITYELLISVFVQCNQAELALEAFREMVGVGLEPTEDTLKAIVASCTKEGRWELALGAFMRMRETGMKPSIVSWNSILNALARAGECELALKVYHAMTTSAQVKPDEYTWSALLSAFYRSNRFADVLLLFRRLRTKHQALLNSHLYNIALMSCKRLRCWDRALQLLWEMERRQIEVLTTSYNHVIGACEAARKPKVAIQVYQHMIRRRHCSPDTFTYSSLIRACIWGSLWIEIEKLVEGLVPDSSLYNAIVQGCCLRGKTALARRLYEKMRDLGLRPDGKTRALMLQQLAKKGAGDR